MRYRFVRDTPFELIQGWPDDARAEPKILREIA
jgi:hypothetical protein